MRIGGMVWDAQLGHLVEREPQQSLHIRLYLLQRARQQLLQQPVQPAPHPCRACTPAHSSLATCASNSYMKPVLPCLYGRELYYCTGCTQTAGASAACVPMSYHLFASPLK